MRIAVVDNKKLKDMDKKKHIQSMCPINRAGTECIYFEETNMFIDERSCIGCGICVNAAPDAISIVNLPEQWNKQPIHRYKNKGFALYNLPTPSFGKIVGILGRNGIGKSTTIKIISGLLKPNLGEGKEKGFDVLIDYFKGTEAQRYFEKMNKGEVRVSYKPQQVELIPKTTTGTVREILEKVDEEKTINEIAKKLDIEKVMDRNIKDLSGGELQRVAIAASVLKKAELYIFDEPTSFLDIKQRLRIANFIRGLANEKTAVLVVEHDFVILDYMTDLVHIMYGKEGTYGAVSHVMTTKNGMNTYLEGYLKDENMRFRNNKITFTKAQGFSKGEQTIVTTWKNITKKLDKFELEAKEGEIRRKDVIGILGENGTGKTTFAKILAEVIKTDTGSVKKVKISYKPQYLSSDSEELVVNFLKDSMKYEAQILIPLNVKKLMLQRLKDLSGGELQRVAIAHCLSQDAELYLLDEPSAYLDVEQRLSISKVIKDFMEIKGKTAVVIDHDLLFIDYLSDKILVFDGTPGETGCAEGPFSMVEGMNKFLEKLKLTFRRDPETNRPRANKKESQKDAKQRKENKWYDA